MGKVENYTQQAISIANDNKHGYSQHKRWGNPDYDCSSLIITVVQNSGIPVKSNGATYTGNMYRPFINSGFKDVTNSVNLRTGSGLKRGDVLLNPGRHTEIYIGNGKNVGARISEIGKIYGKGGDQTGQEIRTHNYFNYPWTYVLRYPESNSSTDDKSTDDKSTNNNYITLLARDVIQGEYGNGNSRKENIYRAVQSEVNNIINKRKLKNDYVTEIAREVIQNKYGTGKERKNNIYKAVQKEVSRLL